MNDKVQFIQCKRLPVKHKPSTPAAYDIFLIIVHNQHTWYIHINSYSTKTKQTYRRIDRKKDYKKTLPMLCATVIAAKQGENNTKYHCHVNSPKYPSMVTARDNKLL